MGSKRDLNLFLAKTDLSRDKFNKNIIKYTSNVVYCFNLISVETDI